MGTQASFLVTASWENALKNESNSPYTPLEKKKAAICFLAEFYREGMTFVAQTPIKVDMERILAFSVFSLPLTCSSYNDMAHC